MFNRWRRQGLVIIFRPLASGFFVRNSRTVVSAFGRMVASAPHPLECYHGVKPLIYRWDINAKEGRKRATSHVASTAGPTHYFMTSPYQGKSSPNQLFLFLLLYYP